MPQNFQEMFLGVGFLGFDLQVPVATNDKTATCQPLYMLWTPQFNPGCECCYYSYYADKGVRPLRRPVSLQNKVIGI
jgi:hypothetical protein